MNDLKKYTKYLENKNLAFRTIQSYTGIIQKYQQLLLNTTNLHQLFQRNLKKYEPATIQTERFALFSYAKFKKVKIDWERIISLVPKVQKKFFTTINESELFKLKQIRKEKNRKVQERNNLILNFLFYTGIRASELVNIKHLDYQGKSLRILGKGNRIRYIPLPPFLVNQINPCSLDYLFTNQQGGKLSTRIVRKFINKRAKLAGINKIVSPHTFRRSFATLLNNKGVRLTTIQKLLGHSNIETTVQYIHNDYQTLYDDYSKLWKTEGNILDYAN